MSDADDLRYSSDGRIDGTRVPLMRIAASAAEKLGTEGWLFRTGSLDELRRKDAMYRFLKRFGVPLLLVVVIALGAYGIDRIRHSGAPRATVDAEGSGITANFNPKHITYEITGSGGKVSLNYLDDNGQPNLVENAALPWSFTIVTTMPSMSANIMAQGEEGVSNLKCRVTVDGQVRDDRTSNDTIKPFIYCLVKSV